VRDIVRHATFIAACLLLFGLPNDLNRPADLSSPIYHSSPLNIVHFLSLLSALFPWIPVQQHSCSWDMLVPRSKGSASTKTVHGNLCSNPTATLTSNVSPHRHFPNFSLYCRCLGIKYLKISHLFLNRLLRPVHIGHFSGVNQWVTRDILYYIILYYIILYYIILYYIILYYIILYGVIRYGMAWYDMIWYGMVWHDIYGDMIYDLILYIMFSYDII